MYCQTVARQRKARTVSFRHCYLPSTPSRGSWALTYMKASMSTYFKMKSTTEESGNNPIPQYVREDVYGPVVEATAFSQTANSQPRNTEIRESIRNHKINEAGVRDVR